MLDKYHVGLEGGQFVGKEMTCKILESILWYPTLHSDALEYCRSCDIFQCAGKPSQWDEIPLVMHMNL